MLGLVFSFSKAEGRRWGGYALWLQSRRVEAAQRGGRQEAHRRDLDKHCCHQKPPAMIGQGVGCGEPGVPSSGTMLGSEVIHIRGLCWGPRRELWAITEQLAPLENWVR